MKLHTKLIYIYSAIIVFMILLQTVFFQNQIKNIFERYVADNVTESVSQLKEEIVSFYHTNGTLNGIQTELFPNTTMMQHGNHSMMHGMGMGMMTRQTEVYVADWKGKIIASSTMELLGESSNTINGVRENILVEGKKIGEVIVKKRSMQLLGLEQEFIQSANFSAILSGFVAIVFAMIISVITAKKILKPLDYLMLKLREVGKGKKFEPVKIATNDEFQELSTVFNNLLVQLQKNEEIRKMLVADVAHELRTPLAILQGRLESIQEGATNLDEQVILELSDEVYRLTRLVNDLQQLSLAEAGQLALNKQQLNIQELLKKVCSNFEAIAAEKQIELSFIKMDELVIISGDRDRLTQVFVNLIGNALKMTSYNGTVSVLLKLEKERVKIAVCDTGPGIGKEHLPLIFERFYKTNKARNRSEGGSGLGLSIAKGFIEAHGGRIEVASEIGKGTTFTVYLPTETSFE